MEAEPLDIHYQAEPGNEKNEKTRKKYLENSCGRGQKAC